MIEIEAFSPCTAPVGVPVLVVVVVVLLVPLLVLPQPRNALQATISATARARTTGLRLVCNPRFMGIANPAPIRRCLMANGARAKSSKNGSNSGRTAIPAPEDAVLAKVRVAVAVPFAGRVNALSAQEIFSEAAMPQVGEERLPAPVRPFALVKVSVVETDCPGAVIVSAVGFAAILNVGLPPEPPVLPEEAGATVNVAD